MVKESSLERLANEIFEAILLHINEPQELNVLSQTSRAIYHKVTPKLYRSWSYYGPKCSSKKFWLQYGLRSSSKPLRRFLQTVLWRPDLAVHVKVLDLREWADEHGPCPRLEEFLPGVVLADGNVDDNTEEGNEEASWGDSDEDNDGDYEPSESATSDESEDDSNLDSEDDLEDKRTIKHEQQVDLYQLAQEQMSSNCPREQARDLWERVFLVDGELSPTRVGILQKTALSLGLHQEFLIEYHTSLLHKSEDVLIALLLSKVPNLETIYFVFPERNQYYTYPDDSHPFKLLISKSMEDENSTILKHLENLYMISALHIGPKYHREYELDLENLIPFLRLPSLRAVFSVQAHTLDDPNFPPPDLSLYTNVSKITTLSYDQAMLVPNDAINTLAIPKALETFRWSQEVSCFSIGSCYGPFTHLVGLALQKHKNSLKVLDLDLRHKYCKNHAHAGNPHATFEQLRLACRGDSWRPVRQPQDGILIGSLKDFVNLNTLSIDVASLCGHQNWAPSPVPMADLLPSGLTVLCLRVLAKRNEELSSNFFDNRLWLSRAIQLVTQAKEKLPILREIGIDVVSSYHEPLPEIDMMFLELETACEAAGIAFVVNAVCSGKTEIPYFLEQTEKWYPGLD